MNHVKMPLFTVKHHLSHQATANDGCFVVEDVTLIVLQQRNRTTALNDPVTLQHRPALLFLIWMSDAATVYSFMIGDTRPGADQVWRFHAWTSLMGGVFALIVFHITAFAVPLLLDRRATLVGAVVASVRGIWTNGPAMATWAGVLAVAIIATVFVPPLLGVSLPWLAFVSDLLYLRVYPSRPK